MSDAAELLAYVNAMIAEVEAQGAPGDAFTPELPESVGGEVEPPEPVLVKLVEPATSVFDGRPPLRRSTETPLLRFFRERGVGVRGGH